jgi:protein tyrosine/serine phosphatase
MREFFGDRPDEFFRPAMIADATYLDAGMTRLEQDYGDLYGYLCDGLSLSDAQVDKLQRLLVAPAG